MIFDNIGRNIGIRSEKEEKGMFLSREVKCLLPRLPCWNVVVNLPLLFPLCSSSLLAACPAAIKIAPSSAEQSNPGRLWACDCRNGALYSRPARSSSPTPTSCGPTHSRPTAPSTAGRRWCRFPALPESPPRTSRECRVAGYDCRSGQPPFSAHFPVFPPSWPTHWALPRVQLGPFWGVSLFRDFSALFSLNNP